MNHNKNNYDAGADRYLLRHETANEEHYKKLHPGCMSLQNRIQCLRNLKEIGYQIRCWIYGSFALSNHQKF